MSDDHLYPEIEPYDHGLLDVGDGNHVYWEVCGNPSGKPALVVHGGPGGGCAPGHRRAFDPSRYRIVLFDQRGCGRSRPHASDPATDMSVNTTQHLVADMELLRRHLDVDRWLLYGGSWGSSLILAYAQAHPSRVSAAVICAVTSSRRSEIEWLYGGVGRFLPQEWEAFRDVVPAALRDGDDALSIVRGYAAMLEDPDPAVRAAAVRGWATWEDAILAIEPNSRPDAFSSMPADDLAAMVRICAHYFANDSWLSDGQLLRDADRLSGIPAVLLHGRFDLGGPLRTAWEVAQAWPGATLEVIGDSGHLGSPDLKARRRAALDAFATS